MGTKKAQTQTHRKTREWTASRVAVGCAAAGAMAATGYINVSPWVAQGTDAAQQVFGGMLATSFELAGAGAMAWAGHQLSKGRPLRAGLTATVAFAAIYANTNAAQSYWEAQFRAEQNVIELSAAGVAAMEGRIDGWESEIVAITVQYDGGLPRTEEELRAHYSWLQDGLDPQANPRAYAAYSAELAAREHYDTLRANIDEARVSMRADVVAANDHVRSVIPKEQLPAFIWGIELFKGGAFFLLGTGDLGAAFRRSGAGASGAPQPTPKPPMSDAERARRRNFAIVREKQRRAAPKPPR